MTFTYKKILREFPVPVKTSAGIFPARESLLITLTDSDGNSASGECAPWVGFGCEALAEAEAFLAKQDKRLPVEIPTALPCLAHAVSAARFFLKNPNLKNCAKPKTPACAKLLSRSVTDSPEKLLEDLMRERENGFRVFKIKVGLENATDELAFCEKILSATPPGIKIRFDANGAFSEETLPALAALSAFPTLDFVEQPLPPTPQNDALIFALAEKSGAKFALDESVREPWTFPQNSPVAAVVKPLLVSDFPRLLEWLENPSGPDVVISTVFENTPAGKNALFLTCSRLTASRRRAFGLG